MLLLLLVVKDLEITLIVFQLSLREQLVLRRDKLATVPQVSRRSVVVQIYNIDLLLAAVEHA